MVPGVLRALVAMLQRGGRGDSAARNAAYALADMAVGLDGRRPDLASRIAAEDGLLPALAAFAQRSDGLEAGAAVRALAAVACAGGDDLTSLVGRTEGAIPALVRDLEEDGNTGFGILALVALRTIAAASPQDLGRRVLDAGAADVAAAAVFRTHGSLAQPRAAVVEDAWPDAELSVAAAELLQTLAALDAAAVTAALARLLAHCATAASTFARDVLTGAPLSLGPVAIEALARQVKARAQVHSRAAALEALAAAAAVEGDAARPRLCAACSLQRVAAGTGRLRPCAGCSGKGPAGRVLYCGADCQRAHRPVAAEEAAAGAT
jgi:hypothetical protein